MENQDIQLKIQAQIAQLAEKFEASGQDLSSYLDGLLYAKYLHYADYIQLETLLSLQRPRTDQPDELIFIIYHQITELYFKLINWELKQLSDYQTYTKEYVSEKINRIIRYVDNLVFSYDIMLKGMNHDQFMKFRMSLLPASGFQSFQFRLVEIYSTDLINLVDHNLDKSKFIHEPLETIFENLYWKHGAQELASGKKTLTLKQFEEKYTRKLLRNANNFNHKNLNQILLKLQSAKILDNDLVAIFKEYDHKMNVVWPLSHYKSAAKYLDKKPEVLEATGGTNWQKYLPPRFQKKTFFPSLYSPTELENWGKV